MAIQLTPEQEQRIKTVVENGAYHSTEEALEAAVAAVEVAASHHFEGTPEELDGLLLQGVTGKKLSEEEFWDSVDRETDALMASYKRGSRA